MSVDPLGADSINARNPDFTWLAIYRCGTGDWDIELTLTKVRPEQQLQFVAKVEQVRAVIGSRPQLNTQDFWEIYEDLWWCENQSQAETEKVQMSETLRSYFIKVLPETLVTKPARSGNGCFLCILKHTNAVLQEARTAWEQVSQLDQELLTDEMPDWLLDDCGLGHDDIVRETAQACDLEIIEP